MQTYQQHPSGLVVFMRPCFSDCSCTLSMNIQWAPREWFPKAQEKRGQAEMCLVTHEHTEHRQKMRTHTLECAHEHTHTQRHTPAALQRWEERATVTNSFGASKVAGNLSNGTIKSQLSFFRCFFFSSLFFPSLVAHACIMVASCRCTAVWDTAAMWPCKQGFVTCAKKRRLFCAIIEEEKSQLQPVFLQRAECSP